MNFILVPTDFSETAENASRYAMGVAREAGAKVLFMYAADIGESEPLQDYHPLRDRDTPPEQAMPVLMKDLEVKLEKFAAEMQETSSDGVQCYYALKRGSITKAIESVHQEQPIDLIVMGTQGATGWKKVFIGSNTTKVIKEFDIPVLAVPHKASYKNIDKILYGQDLRKDEYHSIKQLTGFAKDLDAELLVTHVYTDSDDAREDDHDKLMERFMEHTNFRRMKYYEVQSEDVLEGLETTARKYEVDIIATQTRERSFMDSLFSSSLTKKLAYHTDIPLLALHL